MSTQHFNLIAPNGQPSQDNENRIGENLITTRQALTIAARACNSLLFGLPHPATFDHDDLSQTLAILSQMACAIEYAPTQPAPYGPPLRTAILDQWLGRIDEVMAGLSEYRRIIDLARGLPPAEVDGVKLVNLESEAHRLADDLVGWIDCDYENDLISNATGRSSSAVCVEAELRSDSHTFDREFWQREVDAVSEDHPEERARLQALLDARYEVVR